MCGRGKADWRGLPLADRRIVGVVGMPGSGKSVLDEVAAGLGFDIVVMGDVIREETARRGLEATPENIGKVMLEIRSEEGPFVVAKRCVAKIAESKAGSILVEGIRSYEEVREFRERFPTFRLVAIHASPETRFSRLFSRGRSDDSTSRETFEERDKRELRVGIGSAIAMADHMLINEGSAEEFKAEAKRLLENI